MKKKIIICKHCHEGIDVTAISSIEIDNEGPKIECPECKTWNLIPLDNDASNKSKKLSE